MNEKIEKFYSDTNAAELKVLSAQLEVGDVIRDASGNTWLMLGQTWCDAFPLLKLEGENVGSQQALAALQLPIECIEKSVSSEAVLEQLYPEVAS